MTATQLEKNGDIPSARFKPTLVYSDEILYMYGQTVSDDAEGLYVNSYHVNNQTWKIIKSEGEIPEPRSYHLSTIYNNEIYVIFGFDSMNQNSNQDMWKFNISQPRWTYLGDFEDDYIINSGTTQVGTQGP